MKKHLTSLFRDCAPHLKLTVVFSSKTRLRSMLSFKDKIPFDLKSLVVYNFQCSSCKSSYIGKTFRHMKIRAYEHLAISVSTEKKTSPNTTKTTVVTDHCHKGVEHHNEYSSFKILSQASNDFHLKLKESLVILKNDPDLNVAGESLPL